MTNRYILLIAFLAAFASCGQQEKTRGVRSTNISMEIKKEISGEVILPDNGSCHYYDVAVTNDYYAFLDYYSDTLLQVLDKKDFSLYRMGMREIDTFTISHPSFPKYDYANKGKKNAITIWDNETFRLKRIDLDRKEPAQLVTADITALPISSRGNGCTNACITERETYTMPFNPDRPFVFISDNRRNGVYRVPPFPELSNYLPADILREAYASDLVINEEKDVIVAALRFVSSVNFYDMNCDMTSTACFGEYYTIPVADITGKHMDAEQSIKSFIDICSSDKYVICLYDGSTGFSSPSTFVVFNWEGEHIGNYRTDRSLRKIAFDPSGKFLIGLAANTQGGRDVIRYDLNKIL